MKIGEVAKATGLSEKAIRLYVENGLVRPTVSQSLHRNSYDFSEENLRELEKISVFRKAGFSLFEIGVIQEQPEKLPELLESKRQSMEMEVELRKNVHAALDRLQASQMGDANQVADVLRPAVEDRKLEDRKGSRRWTIVTILGLTLILIFLWLHYIGIYYSFRGWVPLEPFQEQMLGGFVCLILSMPALFMSARYATSTRRARRLPQHGVGKVTHILEEHGFDGRFARVGNAGAGTREPGIGGTWQLHFMLWNEIRPDCWFPVIRYVDENGKEQSNTFDYGGFKNSWKVGDQVEIAWDPKEPWYLYPLSGNWLKKKALIYCIVGLLLLAAGICLFTISAQSWGANVQPVVS